MEKQSGTEVIRRGVVALVEVVRAETAAGGPQCQRAAALAVTNLEQGGLWAAKALAAEDAIKGDDGGSGTGEPAARVDEEVPPLEA